MSVGDGDDKEELLVQAPLSPDGGQGGPSRRQSQPMHQHQQQHSNAARARGHRKSVSWNSPPPPPVDFNPAPDFVLSSGEASGGIATPSESTPTSPFGHGTSNPHSPFDFTSQASDDVVGRPQIRAIQRLSTDSVMQTAAQSRSSSNSSSGKGTLGSDGGDVLAARRDELVSHLLTGDLVAGAGSSTPDPRPTTPSGNELGFNFDTTGSSSSLSSSSSSSSSLQNVDDTQLQGTNLPRPRSSSRSEETVHAWDSVWPAANAAHRVNLPPEAGSSRFPMAPMSPYVTPSFSPAIIQTSRRASTSPPHSPGPHSSTFEHQQYRASGRIYQARASSSFLASRSDSVSSNSPVTSPRLAAVASPPPPPLVSQASSSSTPASPRSNSSSPGSSATGTRRRSFVGVGGPPLLHRSQTSPTTPPSHSASLARPRAERSSSFFSNQFPELAPPFISRKELLTRSSRLTRRSSETAITRPRPNAALLSGESITMSAVHPPPSPLDILPSSSPGLTPTGTYLPVPTLSRPLGPRRAVSAQDALAGTALRGLAMTPEHSPGSSSENGSQTHDTPPLLPPPLVSPSVGLHPSGMDDSAIEDDVDEDMDQHLATATPKLHLPMPVSRSIDDLPAGLMDEGDMLPTDTALFDADVTFDDEGLTTLERIFLLSRSEYSFHRAYVARVLGDLLGDVDPCEAVEYVLPLLSGFSLDEEDAVKEAFAADLHRILWYFFSTCRLEVGEVMSSGDELEPTSTDTPMEEGFGSMPESIARLERAIRTPQHIEVPRIAAAEEQEEQEDTAHRRVSDSDSGQSGVDTLGLASVHLGTPLTNTSVSMSHADEKEWSYRPLDDDKGWSLSAIEKMDAPTLDVGFFRPLLGTMLLSHNPSIADPVRGGIIAIIDRLKGHSELTVETWGASIHDERVAHRTFLSQTGPHLHILPDLDAEARHLIEDELLHCIVLGMGKLSTDVPESLFDNSVEVVGCPEEELYAANRETEEELYRQQMVHEATLGRALSLSFIGSICEMYTPEEVLSYGFVDEVIRGLDGDATTRAEAALAMSYVVKAAPESCMESLLSVFHLFAEDEDDQVRQSACACLPRLCKRIRNVAQRREFAVSSVLTFLKDNENTRYAMLEALGEVIYSFIEDPKGPPPELIDVFCDDRDSEGVVDGDWDVIASFNFPGVCLTLGPKGWPRLRELFHRLVERAGERVFRTVSAFIHELASILEPEQVAEDVLPVYRKCLEQGDAVRERIFEHIDVLVRRLPPSLGWVSFRLLSDAWNEDTLGGWRAREQLSLHIPSFLETFHGHPEVGAVLDITRSALLDPFAAVRDAATFAVPQTYEILQDDRELAQKFYSTLLSLCNSPQYRQRVTFVRCLREFMRPPPNKKAFEEVFVPYLTRLAHDVVDVRLALATTVANLFIVGAFYGDDSLPVPDEIKQIIKILSVDEAVDVRNAVVEVGADRWSAATSRSASEVLEDKMESIGNPRALEARLEDALASQSSESAKVKPEHDRAALASPAIDAQPIDGGADGGPEDEAALLALGGPEDPFEASFARAASVASLASLGSAASVSASGKSTGSGKL